MEVLRIFNVTKITSAEAKWTKNPGSCVIVAEDKETGELLGGIRMQKVHPEHPLPIEDAIGELDPLVRELVDIHRPEGAGELCGLWNSRDVKGMGLSVILTEIGIAMTEQMSIKTVFGICADFT